MIDTRRGPRPYCVDSQQRLQDARSPARGLRPDAPGVHWASSLGAHLSTTGCPDPAILDLRRFALICSTLLGAGQSRDYPPGPVCGSNTSARLPTNRG